MTAGIIIGIGLSLAAVGLVVFAQDRGWKLRWWQWLLLAIAAPVLLYGVAALGTSLGEGTVAAGWALFGIALLISIILSFAALRPLRAR